MEMSTEEEVERRFEQVELELQYMAITVYEISSKCDSMSMTPDPGPGVPPATAGLFLNHTHSGQINMVEHTITTTGSSSDPWWKFQGCEEGEHGGGGGATGASEGAVLLGASASPTPSSWHALPRHAWDSESS